MCRYFSNVGWIVMRYFMADLLACPYCKHHPLFVHPQKARIDENFIVESKPCEKVCRYTGRKIQDVPLEICKKCVNIDVLQGDLICNNCGKMYPIIDGIPLLTVGISMQKDSGISVFEEHSERYDAWFEDINNKIIFANEVLAIRALHDFSKDFKALEIGVGTGRFADILGIRFGVDPALNALKIAQKRRIFVTEGFAEILPFRNESFISTLMVVTICYVKRPQTAISEAYRILKKNGLFIICFIDRERSWGQFYLQKKQDGHIFYSPANFYTEAEIKTMLEKAGFTIAETTYTLSQLPGLKKYKIEDPRDVDDGVSSFVCIKAVKY